MQHRYPKRNCSRRPLAGALAVALGLALMGALSSSANAAWGPYGNCSTRENPNEHCYATSHRDIQRYGGVLASIDYVDTTSANSSGGQVNEEEWISFYDQGVEGWIETGQSSGVPYGCCEMHPFFAEQQRGVYREHTCGCTVPLNSYNHYVLYDSERNGRWHVYWGCCEVGSYGGGWPVWLTEQEAGIEATSEARPYEWGRQEVAASDGGAWTPWSGISYTRDPGICMQQNTDTPTAEGNIMWGTLGGPPNTECA